MKLKKSLLNNSFYQGIRPPGWNNKGKEFSLPFFLGYFQEMKIIKEGGDCLYFPEFIDDPKETYSLLEKKILWRSDEITLFGKTHSIPRLHAWYGDLGANYKYSKIQLPRNDWFVELKDLKDKVQEATGLNFNSVLCNYYRNGEDSNGWHSDDESELVHPIGIASLSFGETRTMQFRRKGQSKKEVDLELESGSLTVMKHPHQKNWQHQIPKRKRKSGRINLTFRLVQVIS
ncbi:MAG: alpha-ketoglutarate-dependent dioxygenase AlkB, partial [Halobacteriovoraceae bacterium]|nr:alpha-ketoglutarate-dependent dioxygenase AlkB [Halobacteriovoraceae bacterium]